MVVLAGDLEDRDDLVCLDGFAHVGLVREDDGAGDGEFAVGVDLLDQLGAGSQEFISEAVTFVLAEQAIDLPDDERTHANNQHAHGERDLKTERTDESAEPHGRIVPSRSPERLKSSVQASSTAAPRGPSGIGLGLAGHLFDHRLEDRRGAVDLIGGDGQWRHEPHGVRAHGVEDQAGL